jgi:hypothetical protein
MTCQVERPRQPLPGWDNQHPAAFFLVLCQLSDRLLESSCVAGPAISHRTEVLDIHRVSPAWMRMAWHIGPTPAGQLGGVLLAFAGGEEAEERDQAKG